MAAGLFLTAVFVVLQLAGVIDWAWWQIALPWFIEIGIEIILFVVAVRTGFFRRDR